MSNLEYTPLPKLLKKIVDNRGKSVPIMDYGFPLIATNCIKHSSIYPTFDNIRYVSEETLGTWFRAHLEPHDILFVNKGTPGRTCLVPDPVTFCAAQDMMAFRCDETKIYYKYLFAILRSKWMRKIIENYHVGLVIPHFKKQDLGSLLIPNKSEKEQRAIGDIYVGLSEKIELNNKINQELELMAKTIYDYWFVQFDFPDTEGKPYKSSGGKMVYSEELKRDIPEGWEVAVIGNTLSTVLGGTPLTKNKEYWNGNISWLNSGEIANFPIINSNLKITQEAIAKSATTLMPIGTVVISITRHLRPSILAIESCANQSVVGILESNRFKSSYIYPLIQNEIPRYMTLRTGAQQPHINKNTIDETIMIIPTDNILNRYYNTANPAYKKINNIAFQNEKLTQLRDWLLPMLMNGQVKVGDVAHISEELMVAEPKTT